VTESTSENNQNSVKSNQALSKILQSLKNFTAAFNQWRKNNKWKFRGGLAALLIIWIGISLIPNPATVKVYMTTPGVTDLTQENPKPHPLILQFGDSVAQLQQIGKQITEGVKLSPAIAGKWTWQSDRRLIFVPEEEWSIAKKYSVDLDSKLFPKHIRLERYSLSFETPGFSGEMLSTEFYQDPVNPKLKKLVSTMRFSHRVDQEDFKGRVKLNMKEADPRLKDKGNDYPYEISFNKVGNEAYIHSSPVDIPLKEQILTLTIDDGVRSKRDGVAMGTELSGWVKVPGMYSYFRIASAQTTLVRNAHNDPEQVLLIETTDGVHEDLLEKNLEVYLLPQDRPVSKMHKRVTKNYSWSRPEEIGPEILNLSERVQLQHLPADREFATLHSFKIDVPPRRTLYIRLNKGVKSVGGYILANTYEQTRRMGDYPRELEIMGEGGLLTLSGDKKLPIVSRGNEGIYYEVSYVLPSQLQHLVSQTGGNFQNPYFNSYQFTGDNISVLFNQTQRMPRVKPGKSQYTSFDFGKYLQENAQKRSGVFLFEMHGWDVNRKQKTGVNAKRLILITDLGMLVKQNADQTRDVFVVSISNGRPVMGARVDVLGINGVSVHRAVTDANGKVSVPNLSQLQRGQQPTAIHVSHGDDIAFIPYNRHDRNLDLSRFDIGGVRQGGEKNVLTGYLFSDRGIYRPGDTFNIGMIVKSSDWKKDLTNIPLQAVITDPRGLVIKEKQFPLSSAGFESLSYTTRNSSPTGEYEIKLYLVKDEHGRNLLGSTSIKLEEFLPDRMKISSRFSQERIMGWVHPKELSARVFLKNLYGTPATERRITANMTLSPYHPVFSKYSAYRFYDPARADKGFSERLPETLTDNEGEAEINLNLERFASTSYNVTLRTNGYEAEGGRSVSTERSTLVSPRTYLVGFKSDGPLGYVGKKSERTVQFIAIDPALELTAAKDLSVELIEQKYVSALVKQDNGTYKYQSVLKEKKLGEKPLVISNKGVNYSLPTETPGDYVLLVKDKQGIELNKVKFSVAGEANLARNLEKNAELQIKLDKNDYKAGDVIQVSIRAPYTGAGLITIERDKVYAHKWFKTGTTSSVQNIVLPDGIEGNAYVNVSFVRDMASKEIFMSPLSYGIQPFTINRDARRNRVKLEVPYLMRPGEKVDINYQVQQPGKIVVFAVDEGILQVANYTTPDPLKHFFRKKALEVETAQILDLILPEFSVVRQVSAAGGGMYEEESKNLNPFKRRTEKPVAYWSGIIDATGNGGKVSYTVPDYFNGTLRFMAVAISSGSMGVADKKALARGHFVLSPNVPLFVAPGDEFNISLNVANNVEGSGKQAKVTVALQQSEHLEVVGEAKQELQIDEGREKSITFRLKAKTDKLGSANLSFVAAHKDKQSKAGVDLSVRPAVTRVVDVQGGYVQKGKAELKLPREMYPEFRQRELTASIVPLGLSRGMLRYLEDYPHLCTEQLVSKVFPIVALQGREELAYQHDKAQSSIDMVVDILRSRQNNEGAFGFWAANSFVSPKQSIYALHFLHEAKQHGFAVPDSMLEHALRYADQMAQKSIDNLADARVRAYAIYLLTVNGKVTTRYLNEMREQMERFYKGKWDQEISRAYMAAAYKLLHLDKEAENLLDDMKLGAKIEVDYSTFYDNLSRDAQLLYILARHFPERLKKISGGDLESITSRINSGHFNTLSASYAILALDAYADQVEKAGKMQVKVTGYDKENKAKALNLPDKLFPQIDIAAAINRLNLDTAANPQPVFYQATEAGFDRNLPDKKLEGGLEVYREYRDTNGNVIDKVKIGEEVEVRMQMRTLDGGSHYNVAVVDLLPGGFELVLDATRQQNSQWRPDYMDLREDRVILYGTMTKSAEEFIYRIKATNKGQFVVPPTYAEGMYDRNVRYRSLGGKITVE